MDWNPIEITQKLWPMNRFVRALVVAEWVGLAAVLLFAVLFATQSAVRTQNAEFTIPFLAGIAKWHLLGWAILILVVAVVGVGITLAFVSATSKQPSKTSRPKTDPTATPIRPTPATSALGTASQAPKIPTFMDLSKVNPSQEMTLSLDGLSVIATLKEMEGGLKRTISLKGVSFVAYVSNGKFYVDTSLYGGRGISPVVIKGNEFLVKPPNWDKNYDENALEVINQDGDPILQLIYDTQHHIVMYGIFPYPGGVAVVDKSGFTMDDSFKVLHLRPMFKYPSSSYLGQRVDQ